MKTAYIRADEAVREGRCDRTPHRLSPLAYLGEVSGEETPADALHWAHMDSAADIWEWVHGLGYVSDPPAVNG